MNRFGFSIVSWVVGRARRTIIRYHNLRPVTLLTLGYAIYMLIGWALLCVPWCNENSGIPLLDHLFTAVSAVSTTGLTTVSTQGTYSFLGELVVLMLIQLGGLGYMTFGSFLFLISHEQKLSDFRIRMSKTAFSVTEDVRIEHFVSYVVSFTLLCEIAGAVALFIFFQSSNVEHAGWQAIFHSISAFCTAGFSLFDNSLENFRGHWGVNIVISILSYLGALGFIVVFDVVQLLRRFRKGLTLTSRLILVTTGITAAIAFTLVFFTEFSLADATISDRFLVSLFQVMTASTTVGFDTYSISQLSVPSLVVIMIVMVIGASPSGTGGGLKSTSIAALFAIVRSTLRGVKEVVLWNRIVPLGRLRVASASVGLYMTLLLAGTFCLTMSETGSFEDLTFEVVSALGTVGLSRGVTGSLTSTGKSVIILLMFVGRVGVISLGYALFSSETVEQLLDLPREEEDLVI